MWRWLAATTREHARALADSEAGRLIASEGLLDSPIGNQAIERFVRAEILVALRQDRQAMAWFRSIAKSTPLDQVMLLGPATLRMAQIYEKWRERRNAAQSYESVLHLWRDNDSAFAPLVHEARTGCARVRR